MSTLSNDIDAILAGARKGHGTTEEQRRVLIYGRDASDYGWTCCQRGFKHAIQVLESFFDQAGECGTTLVKLREELRRVLNHDDYRFQIDEDRLNLEILKAESLIQAYLPPDSKVQ